MLCENPHATLMNGIFQAVGLLRAPAAGENDVDRAIDFRRKTGWKNRNAQIWKYYSPEGCPGNSTCPTNRDFLMAFVDFVELWKGLCEEVNYNMVDLQAQREQLPTEQLEKMLQAETVKEVPDEDVIIQLLHILEAREPDRSLTLTLREKAVWKAYQKRVRSRARKHFSIPRWMAVAASAVLIIGVLMSVVPQKAEAETFWEMLQRWSDTVLGYFAREEKFGKMEYTFKTDNPGLQQVYGTAVEMGVTEPVVPMWLSDGYELVELESRDTSMVKGIWTVFSCDDNELFYQINVFKGEPAHQYYKDDSHYESYERNGTMYNITRNNDRWGAVWTKDNIECSIILDCQ